MANKDKKLIGIAKGKTVTPKVEKVVETPLTPEQERDLKAKETVNELLKDVNFNPLEKKAEETEVLLEITSTREGRENVEWLQEQVDRLTSENALLQSDLSAAKEDYAKLFESFQQLKAGGSVGPISMSGDGQVAEMVVKLFDELQVNYLNMGLNQSPRQEVIPAGAPNFRIAPVAFMNRLVVYFPFLQQHKKF